MKKAVYVNPKSNKLYALIDNAETGELDLVTVYDNRKDWYSAPFKVDKKGRAYKVLSVEFKTTKNGFRVLQTVDETNEVINP